MEKVVPEACLFTRLAKLEQHLDEVIRRKHIELQEAQRPVSSLVRVGASIPLDGIDCRTASNASHYSMELV